MCLCSDGFCLEDEGVIYYEILEECLWTILVVERKCWSMCGFSVCMKKLGR